MSPSRYRTICAITALFVTQAACDPLVGGTCADGYVPGEDGCTPAPDGDDAPPTGQGGGGDAGGDAGGTGGTGGHGGAGGSPTGAGGSSEGGGDPVCAPELAQCGSACVDLESNPYHCGACFQYCPSESCVSGVCDGSTLGHVAVLGMSYHQDHAPSRHLLGNAVFLPSALDVSLLTYAQHGHPAAVKNVTNILASEAAKRGRTLSETIAPDPGAVASELDLGGYDVLLIHDQALAPSGHGAAFAQATQQAIADFGEQGGIVVALAASNDEMPSLLTDSGLLATAALVPIDGALLTKTAPTDALAVGVLAPFAAKFKTSAIVVTEAASPWLSFVFSDDSAAQNPVVIHKVLPPPAP